MRLGISSYAFTWAIGVPGYPPAKPLTAPELLERASQLGVRVVQFADNLPLDRLSDAEQNDLKAEAERRGLMLEVGTRGVTPDHLRRYLDLTRRMGSNLLRTIPEASETGMSTEEMVESLRSLIPEMGAAGVRLGLENHGRTAVADLRQIVEAVGSPWVGICLDTVNSLGMAEGPAVVVEALARYTVNLHVKEFVVVRALHQMGFAVEGRPAGQGQLNIAWLLESLRAAGVSPNAILEQWTPSQQNLETTIALEQSWATESVKYLRKLIPS